MKTIAVYPGSFDPFHIGHFDIYSQACELFDKVYISVGMNRNKQNSLTMNQRVEIIHKQLGAEVDVSAYNCLFTDHFEYLNSIYGNRLTHVVRGLRTGDDLESEINMRKIIHDINKDIQFVYLLPTDPALYHITSSMIRELMSYGGKLANKYIYNSKNLEYTGNLT